MHLAGRVLGLESVFGGRHVSDLPGGRFMPVIMTRFRITPKESR
jgi:hypothetical protein